MVTVTKVRSVANAGDQTSVVEGALEANIVRNAEASGCAAVALAGDHASRRVDNLPIKEPGFALGKRRKICQPQAVARCSASRRDTRRVGAALNQPRVKKIGGGLSDLESNA